MDEANIRRLARLDAGYCRREAKRSGGSYPAALRETAKHHREAAARYRTASSAFDPEATSLEAQADVLDQMADRTKS